LVVDGAGPGDCGDSWGEERLGVPGRIADVEHHHCWPVICLHYCVDHGGDWADQGLGVQRESDSSEGSVSSEVENCRSAFVEQSSDLAEFDAAVLDKVYPARPYSGSDRGCLG